MERSFIVMLLAVNVRLLEEAVNVRARDLIWMPKISVSRVTSFVRWCRN